MEKMIEKFSKKYDVLPEAVIYAFLDLVPEKEVEDIAGFSNDYLVEFLRRFLWHDVEKMTVNLDWKRFDAIHWCKLSISFGNKLDGKVDVRPTGEFEEWEFIFGYH
jgi:hypothetical protein